MAKINFDAVLQTLDGTPMTEREPYSDVELHQAEKGKVTLPEIRHATLKFICGQALAVSLDGEAPPTPAVKWQTFLVMNAIKDGGQLNLGSEDVSLLKDRIGKVYPPLIMAQAWNLLEGRAAFSTKAHGA